MSPTTENKAAAIALGKLGIQTPCKHQSALDVALTFLYVTVNY